MEMDKGTYQPQEPASPPARKPEPAKPEAKPEPQVNQQAEYWKAQHDEVARHYREASERSSGYYRELCEEKQRHEATEKASENTFTALIVLTVVVGVIAFVVGLFLGQSSAKKAQSAIPHSCEVTHA